MLIRVKAFPNSGKEEIIKKSEIFFEVRVREKPIGGLANEAIIRALASYFKVLPSCLRVVRGRKQRNKIFELIKN